MQWGKSGVAALIAAATLIVGMVVGLTGGPVAASTPPESPLRFAPLLSSQSFADPTVVRYRHGYLAVATGYKAPRAVSKSRRGPWRPMRPALGSLPRWAKSPVIWAADLDRRGKHWTLYYAALAHGKNGRCIGVARSRRATGTFHPVGRRPLVCPRRGGVIDPSAFTGAHHRRYLLYKTQGNPATIRAVRLTRNGLHRHRHSRVHVLLRSRTTVENPVMVHRGGGLVLLASEGYFGNCGYRTTWRRAARPAGLRHARVHTLLDQRRTRLCGPGGADVVRHRHRPTLYFHGWTCGRGRHTCPSYFVKDRGARPTARRALYAAQLRWHHGQPHIRALRRR
jgi:hypothetical protein